MKIIYAFAWCVFMGLKALNAQQLDSILPVLRQQGILTDSVSFILTATDYSFWQGQPAKFAGSMQIIDAANPWPPRWFATSPVDSNLKKINAGNTPIINAFEQGGKLIFSNAIYRSYPGGHTAQQQAILMCNQHFELTDTFYKPGYEVDVHDFAINDKGEKLYFLVCDTTVTMKDFSGKDTGGLISITYEKIQIDNSTGKTIFSWNPIVSLGLNAMYKPYTYEKSVMNRRINLGWSHGNSLCWDKDGNILYSYKYIGIGKISVQDGHSIWRVDRNHLKAGPESDSLPVFLQHNLQFINDAKPQSTYTVISNGDSIYPHCSAYQFTVLENNTDPHLKITKHFTSTSVPETGGGNYDVETNGDYLINYGLYQGDSLHQHILFEYRAKNDSLLGQYTGLQQTFCYRVHKFTGNRPPRPLVVQKKGALVLAKQQNAVWYQLSGKYMALVTKAGTGNKFIPAHPGYYCAVVKYGIGYAVSQVINYRK